MLSAAAVAFLSPLAYRAQAERRICWIPLGGIYWDDEIPDVKLFVALPEQDRNLVLRLFRIRLTLWAGEEPSQDDQRFLDAARSQVPTYPLFQQLRLEPEDQRAQEEFERSAIESFDELFADADDVKVTQEAGIFHFSATFDLTKQGPPEQTLPSWKRLWSRN